MQRGGKVTDGLVGIRRKSGWVSDGNSPKTEEGVTRERRGKVKETESLLEVRGRKHREVSAGVPNMVSRDVF